MLGRPLRRVCWRSGRPPTCTSHVIIEHVYDKWDAVREVQPPRPVIVRLARLWPPERFRWGRDTPIWMRAGGIDLNDELPGLLTCWVCTETGDWLGLVDGLELGSRNGFLHLRLGPQLIRAAALRPADVGERPEASGGHSR